MGSSIEDLLGGLLGGSGSGGGGLGDLGGLGSILGGGGSRGSAGVVSVLIPVVTSMLAGGGLSKILAGMSAAGLDDKAKSWVSTGESKPISADEVRQVVDQSQIDEVATKAGVSHDEAAALIAQALPAMVDHVTPDGAVPDAAAVDDKLAQIQAASR
jgi:uncharacterized protein YidB (DUF937 family)